MNAKGQGAKDSSKRFLERANRSFLSFSFSQSNSSLLLGTHLHVDVRFISAAKKGRIRHLNL